MWKHVCCEVQGRGHKKTGIPCQDKTKHVSKNGVHVIALADGAGSAKFSHFGAEAIVETITQFMINQFQNLIKNDDGIDVKHKIMDELIRIIDSKAEELNCLRNDLASTLLLVAVSNDKFLIVHIGDGVVGYLDGSELKVASGPDNGEFINTTTFVTSKDALMSMKLFKGDINNISGFVIMSDGTEQSFYHKSTKKLAKATIKLMQKTCLISNDVMLYKMNKTMENIVSQNTMDDCSIGILSRLSGGLRPLNELMIQERKDLYQINCLDSQLKKRIARYDNIIDFLSMPKTIEQISKKIQLKSKYIRKHLDKLVSEGIIQKKGALYNRL